MKKLGMAVCHEHDFSFLPGGLGVVGLHPWEAQNHQELGSDGDKERNALLVHGFDMEGDGFGTVGD